MSVKILLLFLLFLNYQARHQSLKITFCRSVKVVHVNFDKQCNLAPFRSVIQQYLYREPTLKFHKEQNDPQYVAIERRIKIKVES